MTHIPISKRLMENQNGPHLVLIPPPFHGHMTPMLQLATVLHSKGFSITIAHTHFNSPDPSNHPNFNFLPFFDGLSSTQITSKNFGSIASWEEKELTEMACGLANSGQSFVWVIRPETVNNVSEWLESLSEDVKLGVTERGWIVKWAPQSEVLAHEAVGDFWSHCGWNSTLESLCEGIPIICQPYFGDQRVNARLLSHVWKVGLEWCNVMERDEIEKVVTTLMVNQEGEELRERATELKHEIRLATNDSSSDALNGLVKCILSIKMSD